MAGVKKSEPPKTLALNSDRGAPVLELAGPGGPRHEAGIPYRLPPSGTLGLATGRVYVRFSDAASARASEPAVAAMGLVIAGRPRSAPETMWVARSDGDAARALRTIPDIVALDGAVHVAPEVLFERHPKSR